MSIIPYGKQNITEEDINEVIKTLKSDFITQGPKITEFENNFKDAVNGKFAIAVSNGTTALHLAALALGVTQDSNVIVTSNSFVASANCIKYCSGNVFFVDINPHTYNIDISSTQKLIESKPKGFFSGVIAVNFAGLSVNLEELSDITKENDMWLLEDACHSPGAYYTSSSEQKIYSGQNTHSDISVFSFHPVKHIAAGEGGMLTTSSKDIYDKLILLRTHGITKNPDLLQQENNEPWYYEMHSLGYNYRLSDINAALALSQLKKLKNNVLKRNSIAQIYNSELRELPLDLPVIPQNYSHAFHLYVIQTKQRNELYNYLRTQEIFTQVHYIPIYRQPYYQQFGYKISDYPHNEKYYQRCLSIPMFPSLTEQEQERTIQSIKKFFMKN